MPLARICKVCKSANHPSAEICSNPECAASLSGVRPVEYAAVEGVRRGDTLRPEEIIGGLPSIVETRHESPSEQKSVYTGFEPPAPLRGFSVLGLLAATGGEADIYLVAGGGEKRVLKLYREGVTPKREILESVASLSRSHTREFVRILETGFDASSGRWYEVQEHTTGGTLRDILEEMRTNGVPSGSPERENLLRALLEQISRSLDVLHGANILHLDLKPENVLVRSRDPLEFVLADFGTVSAIDPEVSEKFTVTRGTPMYQSPESWAGNAGRSSDWWGLGMMALETLTGSNPFKGLPPGRIQAFLATNSPEVPECLGTRQRRIIEGLLTRCMERRWKFDEVSRWLRGEENIPADCEESARIEQDHLAFLERKYGGLEGFAAFCARDETSWRSGKELLLRGHVGEWLERKGRIEDLCDISAVCPIFSSTGEKEHTDPDIAVFRFVTCYGKPSAPVFLGKTITPGNLLLFVGRIAQGGSASEAENAIVGRMLDGSLRPLIEYFAGSRGRSEKIADLLLVLDSMKGRSAREAFETLDALLRPESWFLPFVSPKASLEERARALEEIGRPPRRMNEWEDFLSNFVCPGEFAADAADSPKGYAKALSNLEDLDRRGLTIPLNAVGKAEAVRLSGESLREYEKVACRVLWGYDERVEAAVSDLSVVFECCDDTGGSLEAARMRLFEAYALPFVKREKRLPSRDVALFLSIHRVLSGGNAQRRSASLSGLADEAAEKTITRLAKSCDGDAPRAIREYRELLESENLRREEESERKRLARIRLLRGAMFVVPGIAILGFLLFLLSFWREILVTVVNFAMIFIVNIALPVVFIGMIIRTFIRMIR